MELSEHGLRAEHLAGCLALSGAAGWNQNEADWRLMLEVGRGWGISLADGTLAASTLTLPYGKHYAWISMVLVLPEQRNRGYAPRLLRRAIGALEAQGLTPVLDATPAGREVYQHEGFGDAWGFSRLLGQSVFPALAAPDVRNLRDTDWPWILQLDHAAFGASREPVLRALARRLPQAAQVVEGRGFLFGRDGREASHLGPLVARDLGVAQALLARALRAIAPPVYVDVAGHASTLREWLEANGFWYQRPFTRMVRGAGRAPGDEKLVFMVGGPELG